MKFYLASLVSVHLAPDSQMNPARAARKILMKFWLASLPSPDVLARGRVRGPESCEFRKPPSIPSVGRSAPLPSASPGRPTDHAFELPGLKNPVPKEPSAKNLQPLAFKKYK